MYLYGGLPKPVSLGILILFALYLGIYHALFGAVMVLLRRSAFGPGCALLLFPFVWVAVELARARITGFPWDLLGYSQVDNLLLTRLAPIGGVMLVSFVIAAVNAALAASPVMRTKRCLVLAASACLLAIGLQIAGTRRAGSSPDGLDTSTAVLMQENLSVGAPGRDVIPLTATQEYQQFTAWSLHPSSLGHQGVAEELAAKTHPTIILWPEAPSHFESADPYFRARLGDLARAARAPLVIGTIGIDFDNSTPRGYYEYDSAAVFDGTGIYQGRYDKIHLVPWGEYIPFKQFFGFAHKLTEGVGDMDRGSRRPVFRLDGRAYGVFICYESIFGDEVRQFAKSGAEALVNISDDGWYGDTGAPWQHLNMARMRAIENNRWLLRSTNTGITTAIDPQGRIAVEAPRHTRAAYAFRFGYRQGLTFYTRYGDWFGWLCVAVTLVGICAAVFYRVRQNELN